MLRISHSLSVLGMLSVLIWTPAQAQTTPQEAGQQGMDFLSAAAVAWQDSHGGCFACHTQGMSTWGLSIGAGRGYQVDKDALTALVTRVQVAQSADGWWSHDGGIAKRFTTALAASGLAFYDRFVATDAQPSVIQAARWMLSQASGDGQWISDSVWTAARSEIFRENHIYVTAMAVILMQRAYEITGDRNYAAARARGVSWLKQANLTSTQGLAFQLIAMVEGKTPETNSTLDTVRSRLLANQNSNGSFGAFAGSAGSPYHTGMAIYALRLTGLSSTQPAIAQGIDWLLAQQNADGSWPRGSAHLDATDLVAPNMWPVIAMGEFGELGVSAAGVPEEIEVQARAPESQTIEYTVSIANAGAGDREDTYDLYLSGGMAGFVATLSATSSAAQNLSTAGLADAGQVTLPPGGSADLLLTVQVPPGVPPGISVIHTVIARSQTDPDVVAVASVTTVTPAAFPSTGHATTTSFIDGVDQTMNTRDTVRLAAQVTDAVTQQPVVGNPGAGTVTFVVAGIAVGSDDDSDGDGVFEISWSPGQTWPKHGVQSALASYSGIDQPEPVSDLAPSFAIGSLELDCHGSLYNACTPDCPCDDGVGDCDDDEDCADGARCLHDAGASYGYEDPEVDVCASGCPTIGAGSWNFCTPECPCPAGVGDCDGDEDCAPGLVCNRDVGPNYGLDPELDVCEVEP